MTELSHLLEATEPSAWIEALPEFQKASIVRLKSQGNSYETIASIWATAVIPTTAPFSANATDGDTGYLSKLKDEFRAFLCGSKKYDKDRKEIAAGQKTVHAFVVSTMSVAIAPHVGSAAPVIAPIIAIMLATLGKISLNAWCETP